MADPAQMESRDRGLHLHRNKDKKDEAFVQTTHTETVVDGNAVEVKKHTRLEHMAEAGAVVGGAMAMYEKHQAKKHPETAHKHKVGEAIGAAMAAGSTVYAKTEHDEKKNEKEQGKHHHFGHHSQK